MNSSLLLEKSEIKTSPPLDFEKLPPIAVTLDKLLRQSTKAAPLKGERRGLNAQMLFDLASSDPKIRDARWKQLDQMLGGLNSSLTESFQLLASKARHLNEPITLPQNEPNF